MREPEMTAIARRVSILIPTYKRNDFLRRLISQCQGFLNAYNGNNIYELCITDSDRNNPLSSAFAGLKYSMNPGEGFDDNLWYWWKQTAAQYDFIFSISDDDIFTPGVNPLYLLDAAIGLGAEAVLFNHRDYVLHENGSVAIGGLFYPDHALVYDGNLLLKNILTLLPRHIGLLYSAKLLIDNFETLSRFRGTLHLYAAPLIIAGLHKSAAFFDYSLCLFNTGGKKDGAWSQSEEVLNGLAHFLQSLKKTLPHDPYKIAEAGFFFNYLGTDSWLRKMFKQNTLLKSEEEIRSVLAALD